MGMIVKVWRADSARLMSIVLALVAVGVVPGVWGKILGAVLPLLGGQAVRQTVWAPDTVAQTVTVAATTVAAQLTDGSAGVVGEVTSGAQGIVDGVVAAAVG
jgi:hypothetical protein